MGQDNKIDELNNTNEINVMNDSGIEITPKLSRENNKNNDGEVSFTDSNTESQLTESKLMEGATSQSTPVQSKKSDDSYEMFKMIQTMLDVKFSEQKSCLLYTSHLSWSKVSLNGC